jgi:hypothetical protein
MRIVIEHSHTKREITGAFNICGSGYDLRDLAEQILMQVGKKDKPKVEYGWISITVPAPSIVSTEPKQWDE